MIFLSTCKKYLFRVFFIQNILPIIVSVFHRILDFKNGAGFLSWPLFFALRGLGLKVTPAGKKKTMMGLRPADPWSALLLLNEYD